jgi:hypothetical protein
MRHRNSNIPMTKEESATLELQCKVLLGMTSIDFFGSICILIFNLYYIPTRGCVVMNNAQWLSLWPPNIGYISTLEEAHFSANDICVMVSTMSMAIVVCIATIIPVIIFIILHKPTMLVKNALRILIVALIIVIFDFHIGIITKPTLYGPIIDKSIVVNTVYSIVLMTGWFLIFALAVDRLRSLIGHAIVNR